MEQRLHLPEIGSTNGGVVHFKIFSDLSATDIPERAILQSTGQRVKGAPIALFHRPSALPLVDQYTTFPNRSTTHTESPDRRFADCCCAWRLMTLLMRAVNFISGHSACRRM